MYVLFNREKYICMFPKNGNGFDIIRGGTLVKDKRTTFMSDYDKDGTQSGLLSQKEFDIRLWNSAVVTSCNPKIANRVKNIPISDGLILTHEGPLLKTQDGTIDIVNKEYENYGENIVSWLDSIPEDFNKRVELAKLHDNCSYKDLRFPDIQNPGCGVGIKPYTRVNCGHVNGIDPESCRPY